MSSKWPRVIPTSQGSFAAARPDDGESEPRTLDGHEYAFVRNASPNMIDVLGLYGHTWLTKTYNVGDCEILYVFGHQDYDNPIDFTYSPNAIGAVFNGCWPGRTNGKIPTWAQIPGAPNHNKKEYTLPPGFAEGAGNFDAVNQPLADLIAEDPETDWQMHHDAIIAGIKSVARAACEAGCCKTIHISTINTPNKVRHTPDDEQWEYHCPLKKKQVGPRT